MDQTAGKKRRHSKSKASAKGTAEHTAVASARGKGNSERTGQSSSGKAKRVMKRKGKITELSVVGLEHRITRSTLQTMAKLLPLRCYLLREPDNHHDENAIRVVLHHHPDLPQHDWHIGYLRRIVAAELAPAMDLDEIDILDCDLTALDMETWREGRLRIVTAPKSP